jgi:type IV pilus assembly protein PilC
MATYGYVAMDAKGKEVKGTLDAADQPSVIAKLKEKGLFPTQILDATAMAKATGAARPKAGMKREIKLPSFGGGRVKPKVLMVVTRQLATLIDAGLPLLRGLQVIHRQERHAALKKAVGELAEAIQAGSTLAEAMSHHPKIFNRLYVNMVKAGEVGGVLDVVLLRLAEFMEKAQKIKGKIISAMTYPLVVMMVAGGILFFMMTTIVPKFAEIFGELMEGSQMPALTRGVMAVSDLFVKRAPVAIAGIVGLILLIRLAGRTRKGRMAMDAFKLHVPVFGDLVSKTGIGRFARTLGTLLSAGVPILQALNIVKDTVGNDVISRGIQLVHDSVKEGENIAPPLEQSGIFPPMVISMVEVGEETGKLPDMLLRIADTYDDEVDNTVAAMSSVLEPILIVGLAIMVGTIVIALFLPMISIIGKLS